MQRGAIHTCTAEHAKWPPALRPRRPARPRSRAARWSFTLEIEWVPLAEIRQMVAKGEIVSGPALIGLLLAGA